MSVLPQLEAELAAAHARRVRRRPARPDFGWVAAAASIAVAVAVVVVGVIVVRRGPVAPRSSTADGVVWRGYFDLAYATDGALYVIRREDDSYGVSDVVRINPSSGREVSRPVITRPWQALPGGGLERPSALPSSVLLASGSLWVTATDSEQTWLWRLDPKSLSVRSVTTLAGAGEDRRATLALAGGWLWVLSGDTLSRIAPATGRQAGHRTISSALGGHGNSLAADPSGRLLFATVGGNATNGDAGSRVVRLDPQSGALVARTAPLPGYVPHVAGVVGGGIWINGLTNLGGPERLDLRTLRATTAVGTYHLSAEVYDGVVWVTRDSGGSFCVDAVTGRRRASLSTVVAGAGASVYVRTSRGLLRMPLPASCR